MLLNRTGCSRNPLARETIQPPGAGSGYGLAPGGGDPGLPGEESAEDVDGAAAVLARGGELGSPEPDGPVPGRLLLTVRNSPPRIVAEASCCCPSEPRVQVVMLLTDAVAPRAQSPTR